ncbi:MAG: ribose 5-phosphate isomerase B [Alphaproteobacteria bacterium]|nr:ribose 5-phosphate isomerase B [Alphaproteobacteria bacterium]
MTKLAIACDHGGYALKEKIKQEFSGLDWLDLGTDSDESVDYPAFGKAMGEAITNGDAPRGIVICGSGIGISIAANRFPAVRAALCTSVEMAELSRQHNNANVLALGARITDEETAMACVRAFLATEFEGGRHERRVSQL